jgi:hypothetical protein
VEREVGVLWADGSTAPDSADRRLALGPSQHVRAGSVAACAHRQLPHRQDQFGRLRQGSFQGNLQIVGAPSETSRFIDFFNGVADASITKKLFARLNGSHTIAMSLEHQPPFPRMGLGTVPNEPLTSSHAEAQTQGDLKASVKEIDDLRRGAARRSPNGRASATKSYLSRKP